MKYIDPKTDLTFKRVFGEHPELVKSLLNALLPLTEGQEIESVRYLSPERLPATSAGKDSFVDVYCVDNHQRSFIVEMQMYWTSNFKQRVLFNTSKVYVSQIEGGDDFSELQPVYSLNLVNDVIERDVPEFYHYYRVVHELYSDKVLEGFHIVFVELPKFKPQSVADRKMMVLWLRFLTEINSRTVEVPAELTANPEVSLALNLVEQAAYTREELMGLDRFWDLVRREKELNRSGEEKYNSGLEDGLKKGLKKGLQEGRKEGLQEGRKEGIKEGQQLMQKQIVVSMLRQGVDKQMIAKVTGVDIDEITRIGDVEEL